MISLAEIAKALDCDFYGNGFKWRGQSNDTNGDGDNYVYMCFGEESFNTPYFAVPTAR